MAVSSCGAGSIRPGVRSVVSASIRASRLASPYLWKGPQSEDDHHDLPRLRPRLRGGRGRGPSRSDGKVRWVKPLSSTDTATVEAPPHLPVAGATGPFLSPAAR